MTKLTAEELIDLVENQYFANVDGKNLNEAVACFAPHGWLRVQTADVTHNGQDNIRRMFTDFMGSTKIIYHGDFSHVVDVENQCIASQFIARNHYEDKPQVEMRNANFFVVENGVFTQVTIYMSDVSPLV